MKANEIKKGTVIEFDGHTILVKKVQVQSPSSRSGNTLYKVEGRKLLSRQKFERSFKGDEVVGAVEFFRRSVQLLFRDADSVTFMDSESYDQFVLPVADIEDELLYLTDGVEGISALIVNDQLSGIEIPSTMVLTIVECSPGIKGASASARTKPATLSTGLVIQVPEYLSSGENIKINTESNEFISRAT